MIGTEAERQFYLAAAGIRMWYARDALPGAAPSPEFDFGELDAGPAPMPEPEESVPQPSVKTERSKDHIARLQSLMEGQNEEPHSSNSTPSSQGEGPPVVTAAPESATAEKMPEVTPQSDVVVEDVPQLILQAWAGQRFLLLAQLSEQSSLALQQTLAENILRALKETGPEVLDTLRWPLFNNAAISLNHVSHLTDLVSEQLQCHRKKAVIMLGDSGNWLEDVLGRQPEVKITAGLASLAGDPELKRELWNQLKPLRLRL